MPLLRSFRRHARADRELSGVVHVDVDAIQIALRDVDWRSAIGDRDPVLAGLAIRIRRTGRACVARDDDPFHLEHVAMPLARVGDEHRHAAGAGARGWRR